MKAKTKNKVRERDNHQCRFCESEENLHTHHIIPKKSGGTDSKHNLITVCASCHNTIESTQGKALKRMKKEIYEDLLESISNIQKEVYVHLTTNTHVGPDSVRHLSPDKEKAFEAYKRLERPVLREYKIDVEISSEEIEQSVLDDMSSEFIED